MPKKKKERECIPVPLPPCPPPPDICQESGLTPEENAACAEKRRLSQVIERPPLKKQCRKKPKPPPEETECPLEAENKNETQT